MNLDNWQNYYLYSDEYDLYIKAPINTDFDGSFIGYCLDNDEYIKINGWLFSVIDTPVLDGTDLLLQD
jgi:hypothetical protein